MNNPNKLDRYAVIGNPIGHSLSPKIHQLFAEQTKQSISYEAILVAEDDFTRAVKNFQASGGKGLNITLPFKEAAFALADFVTERAEIARAVNTLLFHTDGSIEGDNTDGVGLINDLLLNLTITIK